MAERLAQSTSPYLRQHADNPVDWWPWSAEAFAHARALDRPVLLSVGYSACHWCHVMAHESFEDPATAALLNAEFVSIKVDREERPDVDAVYQKALSLLGQGGGWPLTVFLTPTQQPFFGGTYFPLQGREGRPSFTEVLRFIGDAWREDREKIEGYVREFARGYAELREDLDEKAKGGHGAPALGSEAAQAQAWGVVRGRWDAEYGGLQGAPKFPNVPLLRWLRAHADPTARAAAQLALAGMRRGGIHDHLGGGFARYSTDARWQVPHFEKMLYDNAQLLQVYAEASVAQDDGGVAEAARNFEVLRGCARFMFDTLADAHGNFFAATDADSEGEEGRFFVWTRAQVDAQLVPTLGNETSEAFCRAYQVSDAGNFEHGRSVLWLADLRAETAASGLSEARAQLLRARAQRTAPARDEKVVTGWNALALRGLCAASLAAELRGEAELAGRWRDAAQRSFEALCATQVLGAKGARSLRLLRARFEGRAHTAAFLEDYAALALAALDLHELCAEPQTMDLAVQIAAAIAEDFIREGGGFHETSSIASEDQAVLIERPESRTDGATPSGLALSVELFGRLRQSPRAQIDLEPHLVATRQRFAHVAARPFAHGALLQADAWWMPRAAHISVRVPAGRSPAQLRADPQISALRARVRGLPVALEYEYEGEGEPASASPGGQQLRFTLCRDGLCHPPVDDLNALWKLLD